MFLNYRMPSPSRFRALTTSNSADVAPGARIAIDPGKGKIVLGAAECVSLTFSMSDARPDWIEFVVALPADGWRTSKQIFLKYRASGSGVQVKPTLRYIYEQGFHDHFANESHEAHEQIDEYGADFLVPPRWCNDSARVDLHLFFTPMAGQFNLHELSLTGVK